MIYTYLLLFGLVLPWLLVVFGCWLGLQLVRQNGRILLRLEKLEQKFLPLRAASAPAPAPAPAGPPPLAIGTPAPDFELPDLAGEPRKLSSWQGKRRLLIFFNPNCGFCTAIGKDLAALSPDGADGRPMLLLVSTGDAEENRRFVASEGLQGPFLLQQQMEVAFTYGVQGTPMGYLIDEQGQIASERAAGAPALLALVGAQLGAAPEAGNGARAPRGKRALGESKIARNGLPTGTMAPEFQLPLLQGGELSLADYRGQKVLLVFSDPHCGPCMQLAPRLDPAARQRPDIQVVMVSRGDVEENRAKVREYGLRFPVALQRQWEVSRLYAMFATPIAYLLDEEGVTTTEVAIGVDPILALLAGAPEPARSRVQATRKEVVASRA